MLDKQFEDDVDSVPGKYEDDLNCEIMIHNPSVNSHNPTVLWVIATEGEAHV